MTSSKVALGFHARTGWATMIAVGGTPAAPVVVDRRRVDLVDSKTPAAVYHAARQLDPSAARSLVRQVDRAAHAAARRATQRAIDDLRASGHGVVAAGITVGTGGVPTNLEVILASHALVHAAEGEMYRQALIDAAERCALTVTGVPHRRLFEQAAPALGVGGAELQRQLADLGRDLGSPWRKEQKDAALVAWMALAAKLRSSN